MTRFIARLLSPVVCGVVLSMCGPELRADDLLVFISAFAAGEDGAIQAYRLGRRLRSNSFHFIATATSSIRSFWRSRPTVSFSTPFTRRDRSVEVPTSRSQRTASMRTPVGSKLLEPAIVPRHRLVLSRRGRHRESGCGGELFERQRGVVTNQRRRLFRRTRFLHSTCRIER